MSALPFTQVFLLPASIVAGYFIRGWGFYLAPIIAFGWTAVIDALVGLDTRNPDVEDEEELSNQVSFRLITWLCVPVELALVAWGAYIFTSPHLALSGTARFGIILSVGISTGAMGITVGHELIHQRNKLERSLGLVLLWLVAYMHFRIEHIQGHHSKVATPEDPASAPLGMNFYRFWPHTVWGSWRSAWRIERRRMVRMKRGTWSYKNRMLWYIALTLGLAGVLAGIFGPWALLYYFAQALVAISLLESVNYLEHYGLRRRQLEDGRWEPVNLTHAWNNASRLTNQFLINLQRHPDHHWQPQRRYQILRHFEESPQLPAGYALMVPLTLVPPLWRRVMDHRVNEYRRALVPADE